MKDRIRLCSRCEALTTERKSIPVREVKEKFRELIKEVKGCEHWFTHNGIDYVPMDKIIEFIKKKNE